MNCRLCGAEVNDKTLLGHLGLAEGGPPCKQLDSARGDLDRLGVAAQTFGMKKNLASTLIARAVQTGMVEETLKILQYGRARQPAADVNALISLLGSIQQQLKQKDKGAPEGFITEVKEAARRLEKGYSIQIGPQSPKILNQLLDEGFQKAFREKHGDDALESIQAQVLSLETESAVKNGDMLGGDVVDYTKLKCIQIKAITAQNSNKFCERLREAATQLKAALDAPGGKREVPPLGFRRVANIRILEKTNQAYDWPPEYFNERIAKILAGTDRDIRKAPAEDLRPFVDVVRVTAGFGKKTFLVSTQGVILKPGKYPKA
jgi:hypothetical protein